MPDHKVHACSALPGALARPDWRPGGDFSADSLRLGQKYNLQRIRRHLRLVHGWGVVCGLNIVSAQHEWDLFLCPGYGIGPCGDEILVPSRYRFSLSDYLWTRPIGIPARRVWIAVEASELAEDYATAPDSACGCGCDDDPEKPSRLADGFRIVVSWQPFRFPQTDFDICSRGIPPCPLCPETCALPLAVVTLPSVYEPVLDSAINEGENF